MPLTLHTADGQVEVPDSYLIVGLDETGHEAPDGSAHPAFGLGGCALPVGRYGAWLRHPWRKLKANYFGGADCALHAADLTAPTDQQLQALGDYFRNGLFGRIAVLTSIKTELRQDLPHFKITARGVLERVGRLVGLYGCDGAVLIHEESGRTDCLAGAYFDGYSLQVEETGLVRRLPFLKYKMSKQANEPFLQVADFIMHAAGGQVRSALRGREWGSRKDFQSVFRDVPEKLVEFMEITRVEFNEQAP